MNKALINNWNSVVDPEDVVYVVGDMFMGSWKNISEIVPQLNGEIYLVIGNHDGKKRQEEMKKTGIVILEYQGIACDNSVNEPVFIMAHDPAFFVGDDSLGKDAITNFGKDIIWLYGHVHDNAPSGIQKEDEGVYSFHVGVDTNNYAPVSWDYIVEQYKIFREDERKKA